MVAAFLLPQFAQPSPVAPLSAYEPGSDGAASFAAVARSRGDVVNVGSSLKLLRSAVPADTLLILHGVPMPPSPEDLRILAQFVEDGGRVLLLDDVGYGNELARTYGVVYARIELQDPDFVGNQSLVHTTLRLPNGDVDVILNRPTALLVEPDVAGESWGNSSAGSFLDLNGDRIIDLEDRTGPFSLVFATETNTRGGRWVFVADADPFSNGMLEFQENQAALEALLDVLAPVGDTILVDERVRSPGRIGAAATRAFASAADIGSHPAVRALVVALPLIAVVFLPRLPSGDESAHRHDLGARSPAPAPRPSDVNPSTARSSKNAR